MNVRLFHTALSLVAAVLLTPIAFAQDAKPDEKKAEKKVEKKEEKKKADIEVTLEGNDLLQFDKKAFTVTEGQTVALTIKHTGKIPKSAMGHNIVILNPGTDLAGFATKGMAAGAAKDFVPDDEASKKAVLAKTKMVGGGESDTTTFTAPAPGKYEFLCTFLGHFALMKGTMTVVEKKKDGAKSDEKKE